MKQIVASWLSSLVEEVEESMLRFRSSRVQEVEKSAACDEVRRDASVERWLDWNLIFDIIVIAKTRRACVGARS